MASIATKGFPVNTRRKLQGLLDEADTYFFAHHPDEQMRVRFHFRGERMDDRGEPTRYVVVSRQSDGTLTRRIQREGATA